MIGTHGVKLIHSLLIPALAGRPGVPTPGAHRFFTISASTLGLAELAAAAGCSVRGESIMRAEKLEQLTALLKAIPPDKAVALARAVETMQQSDPASFPAKAVLDALAPALATARRERSALQPMTCV